jgi:membrane protein
MTSVTAYLRRLGERPALARASRFGGRLRDGWTNDNAGGLAAEVAFFALLSVFPGLLAVVAAVGWLDGLFGGDLVTRAEERILEVLQTFLTDRADGTVEAVEQLFSEGSGGVFTVGVIAALWSASRGTAAILRAVAAIYDTRDERSWLRRRLLALALAVGSMFVMALTLAMLVLGPLLGAGRAAAEALGVAELYGRLWEWMGIPVALAILMGWAVVILHAAPHDHQGWRHHVVGAAVAGTGWLVGSLGFRAYLAVFGGNAVFGVLGGALVVLLWLYVLSLALMAGAEVNAVLDHPDRAPEPAAPMAEPAAEPVAAGPVGPAELERAGEAVRHGRPGRRSAQKEGT